MQQVRLRDVAERALVSAQTVSRVLRAPHLVAPETAERVRAAMADLDYLGNEQATALRLGRTQTIGLLFHLLDSLPMPFPLDVIAGAEERAFARGYSLVMCDSSGPSDKEADYLSLLLSQRVAGIIYTAPRCRPDLHPACASLLRSGIPVVVISSDPQDLPYCHVRTDDVRAGYVAARHLLDVERRRIAIVAATSAVPTEVFSGWPAIADRLKGATAGLREAGLAADDVPLYLAPNTFDGGRIAGEMILARQTIVPDGIFVTTDILGLGLLEALRSSRVHVPDDIAVVGHDDLFTSSIAVPALTTIAPPRRQMGRDSIDLLLRAEANRVGPVVHMLDAELIVRESTIGAGTTARDGLRTPLSSANAWSEWRRQLPAAHAPGEVATSRVTVSTLGQQEKVDSWPHASRDVSHRTRPEQRANEGR